MITEMTASTFLVRRDRSQWLVGLAWHNRLEIWLPTGGHQEDNGESLEQTALREAAEEAGVEARLLSLPLPAEFPHDAVAGPWWIVEMPAGPDNHTPVPHIHRDHVFVAEVDDLEHAGSPECEVRWFTQGKLGRANEVSEDSRLQAVQILSHLHQAQRTVEV